MSDRRLDARRLFAPLGPTYDRLGNVLSRGQDPPGLARPLRVGYVEAVLPLAGRIVGRGWAEVGEFLGSSVRSFWERYPLGRQLELWLAAGMRDLQARRLSLAAAVVIWGRKA